LPVALAEKERGKSKRQKPEVGRQQKIRIKNKSKGRRLPRCPSND